MRIAVIQNMVDPNRLEVFEHLGESRACELLVVYETSMEPNRRWEARTVRFPHTVLDSRTFSLERFGTDSFLHLPRRPLAPLHDFAPDVVVAGGGGIWSSPTNVAALFARNKGGWAYITWWASFRRRIPTLARRLADPWIRHYVRACDAWVAYGSRAAREVITLGADPARTVIVPNVARTLVSSVACGGWRDGSAPRFLFVGQLIERKGIDLLVDAFIRLDAGELVIAGDGPLRRMVDAAARRHHRIDAVGHVDDAALRQLYERADVLVVPSRYEVWGLVLNEALANGLLVIASDQVGAADDLVDGGRSGLIVESGSVPALERALREISAWDAPRVSDAREVAVRAMSEWRSDRAASRLLEACELAVRHRASRRVHR